MAVCQNLVPLVNIKIAGKWMFIPLKMVLIGIDPYPYLPLKYQTHVIVYIVWCFPSRGFFQLQQLDHHRSIVEEVMAKVQDEDRRELALRCDCWWIFHGAVPLGIAIIQSTSSSWMMT